MTPSKSADDKAARYREAEDYADRVARHADQCCQEDIHVPDNQGLCWHCGQPTGINREEWELIVARRDAERVRRWGAGLL